LNKKDFLTKDWYFWDPLAAVIATDESIATIETKKLRIATQPEEMSGSTIVDSEKGSDVRVCTNANADKFNRVALQTIMHS
jgi:inosine-uridine nucleoside N-ribohydrolase